LGVAFRDEEEASGEGAEVARFLGVTTSSVNRLAAIEEMPDLMKYFNML